MTRAIAAVLASLVLASCTSAEVSTPLRSPTATLATATARPSATATEEPSESPASGRASASPSANSEALVIPDIEVGDYLEVTGSGLAVRAGPGAQHALVSEFMIGQQDPIEVTRLREEVRLPAGHVVLADLGPVVVDDTVWWAVHNVPQAGQASVDPVPVWRSVAPVAYSEPAFQLTWIAVAQPGVTLVTLTDQPSACPCYGDVPPVAIAAGTGAGRIGPWTNQGPAWITIAAAAPSSTSSCAFHIDNQDGQPMFFDEAALDYQQRLIPGVSPAPDAAPDAQVWLDVTGDCGWAAKVYLAQG